MFVPFVSARRGVIEPVQNDQGELAEVHMPEGDEAGLRHLGGEAEQVKPFFSSALTLVRTTVASTVQHKNLLSVCTVELNPNWCWGTPVTLRKHLLISVQCEIATAKVLSNAIHTYHRIATEKATI
jgi:hypothetical protein